MNPSVAGAAFRDIPSHDFIRFSVDRVSALAASDTDDVVRPIAVGGEHYQDWREAACVFLR